MFVTYWMWRGSVCSDKGFELLCHSVIIRHQVPLKTDPYIVGTASTHRWLALTHFFHVHRTFHLVPGVYVSRSFLPSQFLLFSCLNQPRHTSSSLLQRRWSLQKQWAADKTQTWNKSFDTKGPALTDSKSVCSFFLALPALMTLVDRPTQLFYIWISLCCKYTNLRSTAGQSAMMA